jgi:hypothetical protein
MTAWIVVGLLGVAALGLLWAKGKMPYRHRGIACDDLERFLSVLFDRGYPDGFMTIRGDAAGPDPRFLQLALKVDATGARRLELAFPVTTWTEAYLPRMEVMLTTARLAWTRTDTPAGGAVRGFLRVSFVGPGEAAHAARVILEDVLGFGGEARFEVKFEGVSPS